MSLNLLTANETDPVIWRGPVIAGVVTQFWKDVVWGDVDYMFVDMPPGTGDVPLTVFQSLPVDGVIVVTSPQDLVSMKMCIRDSPSPPCGTKSRRFSPAPPPTSSPLPPSPPSRTAFCPPPSSCWA